jgi:hypothetical protein
MLLNLTYTLAEEKAITVQFETLEKSVFETIDNFILTELWEMPFTFPQLEDGLRNLQFVPSFTDLNNYIMNRLESEPSFLQQVYFDETLKEKNEDAYSYLLQDGAIGQPKNRRLYLNLNNPKLKMAI